MQYNHVHTMFHEEDTTEQIQFLLQNTITVQVP